MANGNGNGNTAKWATIGVSLAINVALAVALAMSGARGKSIEEATQRTYANERNVSVLTSQYTTLERTMREGFAEVKALIRNSAR